MSVNSIGEFSTAISGLSNQKLLGILKKSKVSVVNTNLGSGRTLVTIKEACEGFPKRNLGAGRGITPSDALFCSMIIAFSEDVNDFRVRIGGFL